MTEDVVELFLESNRLIGREAEAEAALRSLPGVTTVEFEGLDTETVESRILVGFDPGQTNPILMEDRLQAAGFSVLSAGERRPDHG